MTSQQILDREKRDREKRDREKRDRENQDRENQDREALNSESPDSKASDSEHLDNEALDTERLSTEISDSEFLESEDIENLEIVTELDISHLVIEDDTPADNFQSAQQQRLFVEPLYSSQVLPSPMIAEANVGLFYKLKGDPIVPDMLLSLGVQRAADYSKRCNRSYFVWEFGKLPEVCIEIVSNQEGDELTLSKKSQQKGKTQNKKELYAQIGIPYYVVFDPLQQIQDEADMNGALLRVWMLSPLTYKELTPPEGLVNAGTSVWLEDMGVGLMLWAGTFEETIPRLWLRWCDVNGQPIPTGAEGQAIERQRAEAAQQQVEAAQQQAKTAQQRAERLADRLRAMGIDPDELQGNTP